MGIDTRIAHFPPDCSKYNPIEHRLFPHISTAEMLAQAIQRTKTGIRVMVNIDQNTYETNRKRRPDYKDNNAIKYD